MTAPSWENEERSQHRKKLTLNCDAISSKRHEFPRDEIGIYPNISNKKLKKLPLPPTPSAVPVEKPSTYWTPEEVNEVNKIDDKIERGRKIGETISTLILGKLPPVQERKGNQPSSYNPFIEETTKPIKFSFEQLKYPLKG